MELSPKQREMIRHAIGFDGRSKTTYRNHYVMGSGCGDHEEWMDLVRKGYATRREPSELSGGDDTFFVTRETALFVPKPDEHISRDFREYRLPGLMAAKGEK